MKDHEIRETVSRVTDLCFQFRDSQQLRERIANFLVPILQARAALATTETDAIAPTEGASRRCQSCGNDVAPGMDADHEDWCSKLGWKKRALEAEALNRKFMESVNGPTHMGEPVTAAPSPEAPAVDALTTGAAAYDMAYANGNRGLVYPEELAHIEKARIVTGYVATPLYFAHPATEPETLTEAQRMNLLLHADDLDFMGRGDEAKALRNILAHPAPSPKSLTDEQREALRFSIRFLEDEIEMSTAGHLRAILRAADRGSEQS